MGKKSQSIKTSFSIDAIGWKNPDISSAHDWLIVDPYSKNVFDEVLNKIEAEKISKKKRENRKRKYERCLARKKY